MDLTKGLLTSFVAFSCLDLTSPRSFDRYLKGFLVKLLLHLSLPVPAVTFSSSQGLNALPQVVTNVHEWWSLICCCFMKCLPHPPQISSKNCYLLHVSVFFWLDVCFDLRLFLSKAISAYAPYNGSHSLELLSHISSSTL